jgi:hypothetical protein
VVPSSLKALFAVPPGHGPIGNALPMHLEGNGFEG